MYNIKSDNVSYLVPVECIDLGYMKRNIHIGDTVKPLWTPHQKEYCQFQLKAWRKDTDKNLEKNVTTICHICNIAVPVIYIKEHNNSKKHKNFLKIIFESLDRVKKNINVDIISQYSKSSVSTYYCEVCSVIIQKNDEGTHKNTGIHQKMQKNNDLIENFLTLYEKVNDASSNDGNNHIDPESFVYKKETPLELLQKYVDSLKNRYSNVCMKIDVVDENFVSINVQGSTLRVHIDEFNGFSSLYDVEPVCLLCKVVITNKESHMWTDMHMKHVMTPLPDQHCIRQINQTQGHCVICNVLIKNIESHKVSDLVHKSKLKDARLINETVCQHTRTLVRDTEKTVPKIIEFHKQINNVHNENTQASVLKRIDNVADHKKLNNSPNSNVDNNEDAQTLVKHTDRAVPKPKLQDANTLESNVTNKNDEHIDKNVHYLMCKTSSPKALQCIVCVCFVPTQAHNVSDHLQGKNHNKNYEQCLSMNKLRKVKNGFACDYCALHVPDKSEIIHVSSQVHKTNMKSGVKDDMIYCELCSVYIDTHNLNSHRFGQKHKEKEISANERKNAKESPYLASYVEANKNFAQVAATSKTVQNAPGNNAKSVDSNATMTTATPSNPASNVQMTSSIKNIKTTSQIMPSTNNACTHADTTQSVLKTKPHYHLKQSSLNSLLCRVCNVSVPNAVDNITTHVNGIKHKQLYEELLKKNEVTRVDLNFYCRICAAQIPNKNELLHIFSNRHVNMKDTNYSVATNRGTVNVSSINNVQPSTSEKFQTNPVQGESMSYHFKKSHNMNELICRVCDVTILNTPINITGHVNTEKHVDAYKRLLRNNFVFFYYNEFCCHACVLHIPLRKELNHIDAPEHLNKVKSYSEDEITRIDLSDCSSDGINFFCEFCKLVVDDDDITFEEHQISVDHVENIRELSKDSLYLQTDSYTKPKSTLKCRLCDCYVNNNYSCVKQHIQGFIHMTMHKKLLDNNKICMVGDKLYCLACKDIIDSQQVFAHIKLANHTGNVSLMK
ncbi:uncharacterized protein LOC128682034 [Plodia interpunctella]|uniref:uncharacterized protein LOC128682034 n=1 Tax=Plodia interpunctella TaxID=58824 RepID=UPI00236798CF|nr:uncharacterized protein LOC128682034 [Plodia interpunctella]XP_053622476.1 uncharacterized protein LOC128682034 [Plodia interpunctella]